MVGRYVTLSHSWGGNVPLITTTKSLATHKQSVPLASLPPTFKDAIAIARKLGVQYLWIDSLCILQDSSADWETEAGLMGDVYGRSYFTIAARGAANVHLRSINRHSHAFTCVSPSISSSQQDQP